MSKTKNNLKNKIAELESYIQTIDVDLNEINHENNLASQVDYLDLLNKRARLENRIADLKDRLARLENLSGTKHRDVELGAKVRLRTEKIEMEATLVDAFDAGGLDKVITMSSPLGMALLGKSVGENVEVSTPAGSRSYQLLAIM